MKNLFLWSKAGPAVVFAMMISMTACPGPNKSDNSLLMLGLLSNVSNTPATVSLPTESPDFTTTAGDTTVTIDIVKTVSGATHYKIYYGTDSNVTVSSTVLVTAEAAAFPYQHTGLTNGVTYYYAMSAVNSKGEGPLSDVWAGGPSAWTVATSGTTEDFYQVRYLNNKFFAVGAPGVYESANGTSWSKISECSPYYYTIETDNSGNMVALGSGDACVFNGTSWSEYGVKEDINSVVFDQTSNQWVAAGKSGLWTACPANNYYVVLRSSGFPDVVGKWTGFCYRYSAQDVSDSLKRVRYDSSTNKFYAGGGTYQATIGSCSASNDCGSSANWTWGEYSGTVTYKGIYDFVKYNSKWYIGK